MPTTTPNPQTWTLRLKAHKTTVLLHVDPLEPFSSIKAALYTALQQTGGLTDPQTGREVPLPPSAADIQLGAAVNQNNLDEGFRLGEWEWEEDEGEDEGEAEGKGKGKAKKGRKRSGGVENVKNCPKGAGLRDGAVLAFRWRGSHTREQEEEDAGFEMADESDKKGDMWGVKIASYEDSYGVENRAVGSGGREFEG